MTKQQEMGSRFDMPTCAIRGPFNKDNSIDRKYSEPTPIYGRHLEISGIAVAATGEGGHFLSSMFRRAAGMGLFF